MRTFKLPAVPPFSLASVVQSHGWYQLAPFEYDPNDGSLMYTARLDSGRVLQLNITQSGTGVSAAYEPELTHTETSEVSRMVTWMLGLDQHFGAFYQFCRDEPALAQSEALARGRLLRSPTLFEDVVKTILTTNTAWSGTKRMNTKLISLYGEPVPAQPIVKAFPTPQALAELDEPALRKDAGLGYRAPYILELAQRTASGELDLEAHKNGQFATSDLKKWLLSLKGVGPYAAANLMMLLGHYDEVPVDSWALMMVSREFYNSEPVTVKQVRAAFERWGEWQGLAYFLWDWKNGGASQPA